MRNQNTSGRITQSVTFYCRKAKQSKKTGLAPLECSITVCGERRFITLPVKFNPVQFSMKRRPREIDEAVQGWRLRIGQYQNDLIQSGEVITADSLRRMISDGGVRKYTVSDLFGEFLSLMESRVGVSLTKGVYRKYELVRNLFYGYIDSDRDCRCISNAVVRRFKADLERRYDLSTSAGYLTKLKAVIRYGMDNGHITVNPFQGVKISRGRKEIEYLSEKEIDVLLNAEIENESLRRVLDSFIIMCGTGLSYSDLRSLDVKSDLQEKDGTYFIIKNRVKTDSQFTSVVIPFAVPYLLRFKGVISNQKVNSYLKVIGGLTGLGKRLYCHLARHTYATFLINRGIDITVIAKCLGNTPRVCMTHYARLLDRTVIDTVAKVL